MVTAVVVGMLGGGVAVGLMGICQSFVLGTATSTDEDAPVDPKALLARVLSKAPSDRGFSRWLPRAALCLTVGVVCGLITGWPVAAVFGGLASVTLPASFRTAKPGAGSRTAEAVAGWTELIRDSLAASAGLAQAIVTTASSAASPIRPQAVGLAKRVANGLPLDIALRTFASEVDDPAVEYVVCALLLAATSRAQRLVDVLSALVDSIREDVAMRLRVDASRASAQSSVRTILVFSFAFALGLILVARSYLAPFGSVEGQLVLIIVGLLYSGGIALMIRLVRATPEARLLDAERLT
jgi:tight adherence protein B